MKRKLHEGMKQGLITLISRAENRGKAPYWVIQCNCGTIKEIAASSILGGQTRCSNQKHPSRIIDGRCKTPEYNIYYKMIDRCKNPNNNRFHRYGGIGITVCERWLESFENFLSDMGPRPKKYSLDRIDTLIGYSPENCRWASQETQQNNRTNNHFITANGETKTLSQWAQFLGVDHRALFLRIKRGWSADEAINRPFRLRAK